VISETSVVGVDAYKNGWVAVTLRSRHSSMIIPTPLLLELTFRSVFLRPERGKRMD
jgi:hypothetical protein